MRKYASFRGRASRSDYWFFNLGLLVVCIVAAVLDEALGTATDRGGLVLGLIGWAHLLPLLAVSERRLHDVDWSGWPMLLLLTGFGAIVLLAVSCKRGTLGPNRFGADPLEATAPAGQPAGTAPVAGLASAQRDVIDEISRLAALRASGSLSDAEFEVLKAQALARPRDA